MNIVIVVVYYSQSCLICRTPAYTAPATPGDCANPPTFDIENANTGTARTAFWQYTCLVGLWQDTPNLRHSDLQPALHLCACSCCLYARTYTHACCLAVREAARTAEKEAALVLYPAVVEPLRSCPGLSCLICLVVLVRFISCKLESGDHVRMI